MLSTLLNYKLTRESYPIANKWCFSYLQGLSNPRIWYPLDTGTNLVGYIDSNHTSCKIDRKLRSCWSLGGSLFFYNRKEHYVSTSTAEADQTVQILRSRNQLQISNNFVKHQEKAHWCQVSPYHLIWEYVMNGTVVLQFVSIEPLEESYLTTWEN